MIVYVVRNMGYVALEGSERSVHVWLRPGIAAAGSLGALLCWLQDRQVERVLLSTFEKGWHHELMASHHATTRLTAMATSRRAVCVPAIDVVDGARPEDFGAAAISSGF